MSCEMYVYILYNNDLVNCYSIDILKTRGDYNLCIKFYRSVCYNRFETFFLDYAVNIFHDALKTGNFTSFLRANTRLPMMYIEDCLHSVVQFMEIPSKELKQRTYNVTAMSFTPEELVEEVKKYVPNLNAKYEPDSRQMIGMLGMKRQIYIDNLIQFRYFRSILLFESRDSR